ncbi:MAG: hypothetical protein ABJN84_00300 [Flavobacteriaceae bacterium]
MLRIHHYIYNSNENELSFSAYQDHERTLIGAMPPIYPEYLGANGFVALPVLGHR